MQIIEFTTDKRFVRRARALKTIETMVHMYCRGHGHEGRAPLCSECGALFEYAKRRLERCVFGDAKPSCANCVVHCYRADMREQIRVVMRWAGPRMMLRHPVMGIAHLIDERRPVPTLPLKRIALPDRPRIQQQPGKEREQRDCPQDDRGKPPRLS
jgi:YbgA-like uncharacterized protein